MTVSSAQPQRWSGVDIDTDAIAANVRSLVELCSPSAVWAVVKANGYGHGAVWASRAALAGGAAGVAVALTQEAVELRAAGIDSRVLILSDQPHEQYDELLAADAEVMVYRLESVDALAAAAARLGTTARVHLKIDTGMRRVGAEPSEAADIVTRIAEASGVELVGVATHLATADIPGHPAIEEQMERFVSVVSGLDAEVELHIGNSAAAITLPESRQTFVRTGIAMYGIDPSAEVPLNRASFTAALRWWGRVSMVKEVDEGVHVSYGWRYRTSSPTRLATVPVGYADGVPRRWSEVGGECLIGGRRRPVVGVVTMDQFIVDLGPADESDLVSVGDEVVLIGSQGDDCISAEEWADRLGTIAYEVVCQIGERVPRHPVGLYAKQS